MQSRPQRSGGLAEPSREFLLVAIAPDVLIERLDQGWSRAVATGVPERLACQGALLASIAFAQIALPPVSLLGGAKIPLLACAVVCAGLTRGAAPALMFAFAAGLVQDVLSPCPLGTSTAVLGGVGAVAALVRAAAVGRPLGRLTHVVAGVAAAMGSAAAMLMALRLAGLMAAGPARVAVRVCGEGLLGGPLAVALVFPLMAHLDRWLDRNSNESTAHAPAATRS